MPEPEENKNRKETQKEPRNAEKEKNGGRKKKKEREKKIQVYEGISPQGRRAKEGALSTVRQLLASVFKGQRLRYACLVLKCFLLIV